MKALKAGVNKQPIMVNKQRLEFLSELMVIPEDIAFQFFLVDLFRLFIYHKVY